MQVIKFEQKDSVGHIVLANPPKNSHRFGLLEFSQAGRPRSRRE